MYICEICKKTIGPSTPCNIIPTKTRNVVYPARPDANRIKDPEKPGTGKKIYTHDPGGHGIETVTEVRVCPNCAGRLQSLAPDGT